MNLHVVVCLQYPSEKLDNLNHSTLTRLPFLTTRVCGVDVYQQWNQSVLINISSQRLANIQMDPHLLEVVNFHRTSVASVMSYIHTSALEMVNQQFGFNHYQCYSPAAFVEFVDMFGKCCNRMWKEQQVCICIHTVRPDFLNQSHSIL